MGDPDRRYGGSQGTQPSRRRRIAYALLLAVIVGALGAALLTGYLVHHTYGTLRFVP